MTRELITFSRNEAIIVCFQFPGSVGDVFVRAILIFLVLPFFHYMCRKLGGGNDGPMCGVY